MSRLERGIGVRRVCMSLLLSMVPACERGGPPASSAPPPATKRAYPPARIEPPGAADDIGLAPGADERDAPNAPAVLPRSHEFAGWVKHEPVRVAGPDGLDSLISDGMLRKAMNSYRIKSVAHCVYRYVPPVETTPLLLDVLWVEAFDPDDAFGLFSVMAPPPRGLNADGSQTAERRLADGPLQLFGWQGTVCVRMTAAADDDHATLAAAARILRARLLFSVPRADPPELLRLLPRDHLLPEREWLVRKAVALQLPGADELPAIEPERLDALLGLDGRVWLAVAAYEVAPAEPPNYVWVARYPDSASAQQAFERYQA
ncbi:MAG TPA: hypothetical protein PLC79_06210, partial [Phycisphaerae bacterium]|nr:hypothetical protein [Phycisphaerae bacterium]